jgi:hypothetical protein
MKMTLKKINEILSAKYDGKLELVHGRGYYFFQGELAEKMYDQSIYSYQLPSVQLVINEAEHRIEHK